MEAVEQPKNMIVLDNECTGQYSSSHPSKTYVSQGVDLKDLEYPNRVGDWREQSVVLKSRKYKNSSKSKSYVKGYRKDRRVPRNKNKDKYVESANVIKSLRSRNNTKTNTRISVKYCSYFEEYNVRCEECDYMDANMFTSINKVLCQNCVNSFLCRNCRRGLDWVGCWFCDYTSDE